jgi:hypothetical protein
LISSCISSRRFLVERRERFVHQQKPGLIHDRPRQRHALPLPAGELRGHPVAVALEPHDLERLGGAAAPVGPGRAAHLQREGDVVDDREMREQR